MLIIKVISIIGVVTNIYTGANYNCHVTNSSTGKTGYFCCDNHEEKDGKCIECKIGYKSIDGKPCVACPVDFYGQKCHARCSCQENERYLIDLAIEKSHSKDIHIIILYTLLASAITICIAVVYFCSKGNTFGACKRPEEGHSQRQMQDQPHQLMQQNRSAEYIDVIDENTYESIEDVSTDDAAISGDANNIISVDNDQNSTSTNSNESARATDGSYLTL
ncbi:unnamed protein product [Mytilus edulis]|uniref:Uncharacterized protein n=1 Tax=Mytilus edulis TaxID=6550 RepID=A0A8S3SJE8_MYTED|nr:unnamed protein product [Mytilus edulis]